MMSTQVELAGRKLAINPQGFLVHFDAWTRAVGEAIAEQEGLTLADCHWTVIEFLRAYYHEFEHPPSPRLVIRAIGEQLTLNAPCTRRTLEGLFPNGGCKQACRIAGLPDYYCHSC